LRMVNSRQPQRSSHRRLLQQNRPLSDSCTTAKFGSLSGAFDAHLDFAVESLEVDWYGQQP
jgi:hypothetical protein